MLVGRPALRKVWLLQKQHGFFFFFFKQVKTLVVSGNTDTAVVKSKGFYRIRYDFTLKHFITF